MSHDWTLKMKRDWMDVPPMIFTGNPLIIKPGMVFFMHMILMDSKAQLAMNLGETYLVTETGNERLGKQKLDLVVLYDCLLVCHLVSKSDKIAISRRTIN